MTVAPATQQQIYQGCLIATCTGNGTTKCNSIIPSANAQINIQRTTRTDCNVLQRKPLLKFTDNVNFRINFRLLRKAFTISTATVIYGWNFIVSFVFWESVAEISTVTSVRGR